MNLHPVIQMNIELSGFVDPTPIQAYTIPAVLKGHDVMATAQTGKLTSSMARTHYS
jgi:ATP-dependent RNA helicase DDX3X